MNYKNDKRTVMTLDAGGTNLVFSAIQGNEYVLDEYRLPTNGDNLNKCLANIVDGFSYVQNKLQVKPTAISFAFPGPADYPNGIIGDLPNLPGFRGGVALGPMLQEKFNLPVFINNDGDLYAYGEAVGGFLPEVNRLLEESGNPKRFKNLLGLTLGTGFGAGIVRNGELFIGDNSIAGEIWLVRNKLNPTLNIEENASIRAVLREYFKEAGIEPDNNLTPKDIYEIATGIKEGNQIAAIKSFEIMSEAVGDAISNAITLIDGLVVIGGGLAGASSLFLNNVVKEMNSYYFADDGRRFKRLVANSYNLEEKEELGKFLKGQTKTILVPGSEKTITYDPEMRIGVGISKIGTSKAISIGAYTYALKNIDK